MILGKYDNIDSRSFRDFIYESNKNGQVIIVDSLENAIKLLK
ncbi:MAG: DUF4180 domain-containing protein [Spirochaetales bacterium]|nr:DUF4180 domain-containing protein [Spirochaetales bacterium]